METLTINIPKEVEVKTVKAVLKALGVSIGKDNALATKRGKKEKPYNPEFVAMLERGRQQIREGKVHKLNIEELWK